MSTKLCLLATLPTVVMAHPHDPYYTLTWFFGPLLFLCYVAIISAAFSRMRPQFPFGLLLLAILFPPVFFFLWFYVLLFVSLTPIADVELVPSRPKSRADVRNAV